MSDPNTVYPTIQHIKVEIGLEATDWVPSQEDVVDSVVNLKKTVTNTATALTLTDSKVETLATESKSTMNKADSALSQISTIKSDFSNLQIGGRNLLLDSKGPFVLTAINNDYNFYAFNYTNFEVGKTYTFSADIEVTTGSTNIITTKPYPNYGSSKKSTEGLL